MANDSEKWTVTHLLNFTEIDPVDTVTLQALLHLHFLTIKPCHFPNLPFLANLQSFWSAIKI